MRDHLNKDNPTSPAKRHFLYVISAVASVAAVSALSTSASAQRSPPPKNPPPNNPRRNAGCLLKGTQILTLDGLKRVESLSIGDHVMTALARPRPSSGSAARSSDAAHPRGGPIASTRFASPDRPLPTMFLTHTSISHRCTHCSLMVCSSKWPRSSTEPQSFLPRRKVCRTSSISKLSLPRTK